MRTTLIVGNWKMNKTATEAAAFSRGLSEHIRVSSTAEIVVVPPFTALESVRSALGPSSPIQLGAQNLFWEDQGAYTGEISAPMLRDLGCRYVILGHSERRTIFGEQDAGINRKLCAALKHGIKPILCVGESLSQRESGQTDAVLTRQLQNSLTGIESAAMGAITVAYEPVWAIGTGKSATPEQAAAAHRTIREFLAASWSGGIAGMIRILYGGSVTPQNIESLLKSDEIDGALIGGACLQVESFAKIVSAAVSRREN